jgi:hypothetical protein
MTNDLQTVLDLFFPFLAALLSYLFQRTNWSKQANTIIASLTVIGAAIATLLVQHKITGNILGDLLLIASIAAALQSGAFAPIANWLLSIGSKPPETRHMPAMQRASRDDPYGN